MKTLAMLLAMAGAALAQTKAVRPQDPPSGRSTPTYKPKAKPGPEVSLRAGTELGWDDNILDLNALQIEQLENGTRPGKFRIQGPGDFVYSAWAEVKIKGKVLFADPAAAGIKVQPYFYGMNPIADFEEYRAFVRQEFGPHEVGIGYGLERDVYYRNLDTGPNLWESAFYDEHEVEVHWNHALPHGLTLRPTAGWRLRDFNPRFDFRDRQGFFAGAEVSVELGRGWRVFTGYEWMEQDAAAGPADPDTSYVQHQVELGGAWELPGKVVELSLRYRMAMRDFTSTTLSDLSHRSRSDLRHRAVLQVRFKVAKGWAIDARYEFRFVNSHQPFDTDPTNPDNGDSLRNVFLVGLTVSL
jgi:hypothetical protein